MSVAEHWKCRIVIKFIFLVSTIFWRYLYITLCISGITHLTSSQNNLVLFVTNYTYMGSW